MIAAINDLRVQIKVLMTAENASKLQPNLNVVEEQALDDERSELVIEFESQDDADAWLLYTYEAIEEDVEDKLFNVVPFTFHKKAATKLKVGDKVIPHSKSIGQHCFRLDDSSSTVNSQLWLAACMYEQPFLFVVKICGDRYECGLTMDTRLLDYFLEADLTLYDGKLGETVAPSSDSV